MKEWYTIPSVGANGAGRGQKPQGGTTDPEHIAGNKFLAPHMKNADDCMLRVHVSMIVPCTVCGCNGRGNRWDRYRGDSGSFGRLQVKLLTVRWLGIRSLEAVETRKRLKETSMPAPWRTFLLLLPFLLNPDCEAPRGAKTHGSTGTAPEGDMETVLKQLPLLRGCTFKMLRKMPGKCHDGPVHTRSARKSTLRPSIKSYLSSLPLRRQFSC